MLPNVMMKKMIDLDANNSYTELICGDPVFSIQLCSGVILKKKKPTVAQFIPIKKTCSRKRLVRKIATVHTLGNQRKKLVPWKNKICRCT